MSTILTRPRCSSTMPSQQQCTHVERRTSRSDHSDSKSVSDGGVLCKRRGEKKLPCVTVKKAPVSGQPPVTFDNGVMKLRMGTSWMDSTAFIEYIKCLFPDTLVPHSTFLIFDSAPCHTAKDVQDYLEQRGILHAIIPGGMTGFCQPADFEWFAQLKNHLARVIDCWKRDGPHQFTRGGWAKPPSSVVVAHWLTI